MSMRLHLTGFTVIGEPQEESSLVHNFLLTSMVILHYIGLSAMRVTTVCRSSPHRFLSFLLCPLKASKCTSTWSPGLSSMAPTLRLYNSFCLWASFTAQSHAIARESHRRSYRLATYSSIVRVNICVLCIGNNRSIGNQGLHPNMR